MAFRFHHVEGGGVPPVREMPSAASKTWLAGYTANLESGLLDNGAAADVAFVGVVNESATVGSAGEGTPIEVILAYDNVVFEVDYVTGTKKTLANSDIGTAFDLKSTALNKIDLDDTTGGAWVCVGYDNDKKTALVKCLGTKRAVVVGGDAVA